VGNSPKNAIPTEKMMHDLTGNDPLEKHLLSGPHMHLSTVLPMFLSLQENNFFSFCYNIATVTFLMQLHLILGILKAISDI